MIDYLTNQENTVWLFGCEIYSEEIVASCSCFAPNTGNGIYELTDESGSVYSVEVTDLDVPITTQYSKTETRYRITFDD
ncbi:UNVERIFIED_CONTAM: hypothetical protein BEN50_13685 [Euhalothece sp. KZN 001]